eukprot:g1749.t1
MVFASAPLPPLGGAKSPPRFDVHRLICTTAVRRPVLTLLSVTCVVFLLLRVAEITKNEYPNEDADPAKERLIRVWRVRTNEIMLNEQAYDAVNFERQHWLGGGLFETKQQLATRRVAESALQLNDTLRAQLMGDVWGGADTSTSSSKDLGGQAQVVYRSKDGVSKVFTPANLVQMCRLERLWHQWGVFAEEDDHAKYYQSDARISNILVQKQQAAATPARTAAANVFPANDCDAIGSKTQAEVDALVQTEIYDRYDASSPSASKYGFFLDRGYPARGYVTATRSGFMGIGRKSDAEASNRAAVRSKGNVEELVENALTDLKEFLRFEDSLFRPLFITDEGRSGWVDLPGTNLEIRIEDRGLKAEAGRLLAVGRDLGVGLPITFFLVWCAIAYQTGGAKFAATTVLIFVLLSMMLGRVGYHLVLRLAFHEAFLDVALFLMLAIGADDFFVLWEAVNLEKWRAGEDAKRAAELLDGIGWEGDRGGAQVAASVARSSMLTNVGDEEVLADTGYGIIAENSADYIVLTEQAPASDGTGSQLLFIPKAILPQTSTDSSTADAERKVGSRREKVLATYIALYRGSTRAAASMFETSLTTALAFFTMATSDAMPIAHFGVYAGCMILGSYFLAVTAFPSVVALQELFFADCKTGSFCGAFAFSSLFHPSNSRFRGSLDVSTVDRKDTRIVQHILTGAEGVVEASAGSGKNNLLQDKTPVRDAKKPLDNDGGGDVLEVPEAPADHDGAHARSGMQLSVADEMPTAAKPSSRKIERGLEILYSALTCSPMQLSKEPRSGYTFFPVAFAVVIVFTAISITLLSQATQLPSPSEPFEYLPSNHLLVGVRKYCYENFLSSGSRSENLQLHIVWGLDDENPVANLDELNRWHAWEWNPVARTKDAFGFGARTSASESAAAVRHILNVGERLQNSLCQGETFCHNRLLGNKMFVEDSLECGLRDTFRSLYNGEAGGGAASSMNESSVMSDFYYNVPLGTLFPAAGSAAFDYGTSPAVVNPFLSAHLTRENVIAESFYRSAGSNAWTGAAKNASKLRRSSSAAARSWQQATWIPVGDGRHPGQNAVSITVNTPSTAGTISPTAAQQAQQKTISYEGPIFDWDASFWQQFDYKLYSLTISAPITSVMNAESFAEMDSLYQTVQRILDDVNHAPPAHLGRAVQVSYYGGYALNLEFKKTLVLGLLLLVPLCFGVLLLASGNVVIAVAAIFTVTSVTFQVMGCFFLMGWELGMLESLVGILVIGLAMDYTLHFAHCYVECGESDAAGLEGGQGEHGCATSAASKGAVLTRAAKVQRAFQHMGPTIFAGFMTSIVAGVFLATFSVTSFFKQMGIAITLTILYSLVMSLVYLPSLLLLVGPEGGWGDIRTIWGAVARKFWARGAGGGGDGASGGCGNGKVQQEELEWRRKDTTFPVGP